MPIVYVPANQRTPAEWAEIERYKAWIDHPRYLKIVPLIYGQYAAAVTEDAVELRRRDTVVQWGSTIFKWVPVKTYQIDNDTIDNWEFIYHCATESENQNFNDELKKGCISAYRNVHGDKNGN